MLLVQEQVSHHPALPSDNGCEDTVKVDQIQWLQTGGYTTIQKNQSGVFDIRVLHQDVPRVQVTMDKVVHKEL